MSELEHYGVKGMKWGVIRDHLPTILPVAKDAANKHVGKDPTKAAFNAKVKQAGGVHKLSDKQLQDMLSRMDLERRFKETMEKDRKKRAEGRAAALKLLGTIGKIAIPIILSGGVAKAATSGAAYKTYAYAGRAALTVGQKALGS